MSHRRLFLVCLLLFWARNATAETALDKNVLIVGTAPVSPPFSFVDEKGSLSGFDMELATEIGRKLGKEIRIVSLDSENLIPALQRGDIDLVLSNLNRTQERASILGFTRPYYVTPPEAVIVRIEDNRIIRMTDLKDKVVACTAGTTHAAYLESRQQEMRIKEIRSLQSTDEVLGRVLNGRADAGYADGNVARKLLRNRAARLKVAFREEGIEGDNICMAVRRDDKELRETLNDVLDGLEDEEKLMEWRVKYDLE